MGVLKPAAAATAASMWAALAEFVEPCYYFASGTTNAGTMDCIIRPVPARFVDGTNVLVGDSQVFIPAAQMAGVPLPPTANDYLLTTGGTKRWNVIAAQLNVSQCVMVLIVRRIY